MRHGSQEQHHARYMVNEAVKHGRIRRPMSCALCKTIPGFGTDGRSLIHAHHIDYTAPLDIEWLCAKCHRMETVMPRGERNGQAKLKRGLVIAARLLRKEGFAIVDIAKFYGVSRPALSKAIRGDSWSHIAERNKPKETT